MKHTKKLIPAIGMLLLSACMLVTSTFAWFSMNESVTATGMSVTAKGDQVYLQIINPEGTGTGTGNDKTFENGKAQTVSNAKYTTANILPVNVVKSINEPTTEGSGESAVTTYSCTVYDGTDDLMWVTSIGESNTVGTASAQYKDVTETAQATNGTYYLKNTFKIRLDPTAGATAANAPLKVASIKTDKSGQQFQNCMNVLVVSTINGTSMGQVWEYNGTTFVQKSTENGGGAAALSNGAFSAQYEATVEIYVFFNGDDVDCTQAVLAQVAKATYNVEVNFTVAAPINNG